MEKGKNRTYSDGFDIPVWLQILIEIILVLVIAAFCIWVAYKISVSDLPNWLKFFLLS
jgi:hypothetical protein